MKPKPREQFCGAYLNGAYCRWQRRTAPRCEWSTAGVLYFVSAGAHLGKCHSAEKRLPTDGQFLLTSALPSFTIRRIKVLRPGGSVFGVPAESDAPFASLELQMILQVQKNQLSPNTAVLALSGRLMMGNDSRQVEWSIADLIQSGVNKVIFDLTGLDGIDSTGVGILVTSQAKLQRAAGNLRIAGVQPGIVHETLTMTHVDRLVPFFPTAQEASENF